MDRFRTIFTLVDNVHSQRLRTVRTEDTIAEYRRRPERVHPKSRATIGAVSIHFMEEFAVGSWHADLHQANKFC